MTTKTKINLIILLLFHLIGLALFLTLPDASQLSYVTLIVSGIVLLVEETFSLSKVVVIITIFLIGYSIELVGTQTGYLFGNYQYGSSLGFKIYGVPIIIGLNWIIIVAASSSIAQRVGGSLFRKAILSAIPCTLLDLIIEPVAISYDFWSWENETIPIFNYLCWFVFSFIFSLLYLSKNLKTNKTAVNIYIIWMAFFIILNFI